MNKIMENLKKNDRLQNNLALLFVYEYGRISLLDESIYTSIKERTKNQNAKNNIIKDDYMFKALEIAREMCGLSLNDLCKYIYQDVKEQKRQERGR
ncbi:MAG: hypothetical protein J6A52_06750 [Bacilli bacterium]|nr:hypothetical protein [Bacilli bacterium]